MTIKQGFLKSLLASGMIAILMAVVPNRIVYADDPIVSYTTSKEPGRKHDDNGCYQSGATNTSTAYPNGNFTDIKKDSNGNVTRRRPRTSDGQGWLYRG